MRELAEPFVSVLMNCYNGEKYLQEAIDSVLAQTYKNWELIFWDNRSTDRSAEIFKSYNDHRLKYFLSHEHTDLGSGRAKHLSTSKVSLLKFWMMMTYGCQRNLKNKFLYLRTQK